MKLHCSKILLFLLPLNILVTSLSNVHSKNKPYITSRHTATTISRVLSECDIRSSIYDNDEDIKSVKECFDRQTSQRFEEYEERIQEKRQKRKEERDKNIKKIIEKDKMDKSLAEKVEKGCLRCGCALGGVAASVGLFGGLGIYGWKTAALATAIAEGAAKGAVAAEAARIAEGIKAVIKGIETKFGVSTDGLQGFKSFFTANTYNNVKNIARAINNQYEPSSCPITVPVDSKPICTWVRANFFAAKDSPGNFTSTYEVVETAVTSIVSDAEPVATAAAQQATEEAIKASTDAVESAYAACQTAIIASVVAILVIVLVMIIIYLVLRYRRKKKMKKKAQYTKLLNE
ncbi:rifin [Plasmodium falciparum NF54]|uniref:Rifin n=2 Tax=Plasmodium falciparum TaxID=5833 RepID=Q8IEU6_PLAF7|nr:rifin [Plasmodium falciparum 3D7]EWC87123.1 hypothetical protein PFNF54_04080 [Plasmodium falciparum NF54]KAF4329841.1 rifin [Plasmodium falciparum NF54]PKC47242.1 rifin [Plasmodium falciparum NF54]CAD52148.1 rifin [Plasmodium falciparum 3D7]|eukprot:XP_001349743.1 rifin [Plasmodium falciparum 3D7]